MAKQLLEANKHAKYGFNGCAQCDAKCCGSTIIFASLYDLQIASNYFPILFYIRDGKISPVYFFYYGETVGQKCPYLSGNLCSIYEERPYACRTYPFSFENAQACFDDGCPQIAPLEPQGVALFDSKKKLAPYIMENFVSQHFSDAKALNFSDSADFTRFCLDTNLLVAYKDFYAQKPLYLDFKPSLLEQLYMLHPQRIAVMRMKNKELFAHNPFYLNYVMHMIQSYGHIEKLFQKQRP
jgi:Fe-S-cluster containining protein